MVIRSSNVVAMLLTIASLILVMTTTLAQAEKDLCRRLQEMNGINDDFMTSVGYNFEADTEYFCGPDAPSQFACTCGTAGVCTERRDPWGRDVGQCGCCPTWVWIVLACFSALLLTSAFMVVYACCLRGKWWFDGYPEPIQPLLPRRGPPAVVPVGMPLPQSLFRGYRIADFSSEAPQPSTPELAAGSGGDQQGGGAAPAAAPAPSFGFGSPTTARPGSSPPPSQQHTTPASSSTSVRNRRPSELPPPRSSGHVAAAPAPVPIPVPLFQNHRRNSSASSEDGFSDGVTQHRDRTSHRNPNQPVTSTASSRPNSDSSRQRGGNSGAAGHSMHVPTADSATDDRTAEGATPTNPSSPQHPPHLRSARSTTSSSHPATFAAAQATTGDGVRASSSSSPHQARRPESIDLSML